VLCLIPTISQPSSLWGQNQGLLYNSCIGGLNHFIRYCVIIFSLSSFSMSSNVSCLNASFFIILVRTNNLYKCICSIKCSINHAWCMCLISLPTYMLGKNALWAQYAPIQCLMSSSSVHLNAQYLCSVFVPKYMLGRTALCAHYGSTALLLVDPIFVMPTSILCSSSSSSSWSIMDLLGECSVKGFHCLWQYVGIYNLHYMKDDLTLTRF